MEEINFGPLGQNKITHECIQSFSDDRFLLKKVDEETGIADFQCMQVLQHSDNVLRLKTSQRGETGSVALCDPNHLQFQDWPLVFPRLGKDKAQSGACGFTGGFDFHISEPNGGRGICEETWLRPRLEAECMRGDGLLMDFRKFECRGNLKLETKQRFECAGSWEDDMYTHTILTVSEELWPRLWLLRLPKERSGLTRGFLSKDIVSDASENMLLSTNKVHLTIIRSDYPSVCENEAAGCDQCNGMNDVYCQKSCHRCDPQAPVSDCSFSEDLAGDWEEKGHWGNRDITVAKSVLYADGLSPFECLKLPGMANIQPEADNSHRVPMVTLYRNGCRPRYTCAEFMKQGGNVLQYRLSQHRVWPYTLSIGAEDVCNQDQFADDVGPTHDLYRSQNFKLLVRKQAGALPFTACGIKGRFAFNAQYMDGRKCDGVMDACGSDDQFTMMYGRTCEGETADRTTFNCIATFRQGSSQFVVTQEDEDPDSKHCWLMHFFEDWATWILYKLRSADCNEGSAHDIRYLNASHHLAEYTMEVDVHRGLLDPPVCHKTAADGFYLRTSKPRHGGKDPEAEPGPRVTGKPGSNQAPGDPVMLESIASGVRPSSRTTLQAMTAMTFCLMLAWTF